MRYILVNHILFLLSLFPWNTPIFSLIVMLTITLVGYASIVIKPFEEGELNQ